MSGTFPSPYDGRDKVLSVTPLIVPDRIRTEFRKVIKYIYQRKIGICVACSVTKAAEYLWYIKTGTYVEFSVRFTYNVIKKIFDLNLDEGSCIRNGMKAAQKIGFVRESDCPTDTTMSHADFLKLDLTNDLLEKAKEFRTGAYYSIPTDKTLVHYAMNKYGPLVARFEVGPSWYSYEGTVTWDKSKILPLMPSSKIDSGHGVDLIESSIPIDDEQWLANSWSHQWGDNGDGNYIWDKYRPTEVWAMSFDPIVDDKPSTDTRTVSDSVWRSLMDLFRKLKGFS